MADLTKRPITTFTLTNTGPLDTISPNFTVRDLTRSELAMRLNIDNSFRTDAQLQSAVRLAREVLQPIRARFWPYSPNSVYRGQALERKLKNKPQSWTSKSQHTKGEAADIEMPGLTNLELAVWIRDHLKFDQLILECYNAAKGPNSGWVHVSLTAGTNRGEILSYVAKDGGYVYVSGLAGAQPAGKG